MIEVYSTNVTVPAGGTFPLNIPKIVKGGTATRSGDTIQLNRAGVYCVSISTSLEPSAAGEVTIGLYRDGVPVDGASVSFTGEASTINSAALYTLVQCQRDNYPCCCYTAATGLTVANMSEVDVTGDIDIVVTKLC